jgi:hypothetical protein
MGFRQLLQGVFSLGITAKSINRLHCCLGLIKINYTCKAGEEDDIQHQ